MTDDGRQDGIDRQHHRKNARRRAAAPAKGIDQCDVEYPKGRMHSAGKSEHYEGDASDEPRSG